VYMLFPPPSLPAFDDPTLTITHQPPARDIDDRGKSSLFTKAKTSPHGAGSEERFEWKCAQPLLWQSTAQSPTTSSGSRGASLTPTSLTVPHLLSPPFPLPATSPFSCGSRRDRPSRDDRGVHAYTTTFEVCKSGEWTRLKFCSAIGVVLHEQYSMEHHGEIELCILPTEDRRRSSSTPSSLGRIGADLGK
jgi:hypothetical protein